MNTETWMNKYIPWAGYALAVLLLFWIILDNSDELTDGRSDSSFNIVVNLPVVKDVPIDYNEVECLAKNVYFESRGEKLVGQVAVAQVVMNRVISSRFPDSICDVVHQGPTREQDLLSDLTPLPVLNRCQFKWYCDGKSDVPRDMWAWGNALNIAVQVIRGEHDDPTNGALWFSHRSSNPTWSRDAHVIKIGNHNFYTTQVL
jgi:spore germination cell wall hydrolase CwlJ-like protein